MQKSKLSLALIAVAVVMVSTSVFATPGTPPSGAPDASSSALLLSLGFAGMAAVKKMLR